MSLLSLLTNSICLISVSEAFSEMLPTNTVVATFMLAVELGMGTLKKIRKIQFRTDSVMNVTTLTTASAPMVGADCIG